MFLVDVLWCQQPDSSVAALARRSAVRHQQVHTACLICLFFNNMSYKFVPVILAVTLCCVGTVDRSLNCVKYFDFPLWFYYTDWLGWLPKSCSESSNYQSYCVAKMCCIFVLHSELVINMIWKQVVWKLLPNCVQTECTYHKQRWYQWLLLTLIRQRSFSDDHTYVPNSIGRMRFSSLLRMSGCVMLLFVNFNKQLYALS